MSKKRNKQKVEAPEVVEITEVESKEEEPKMKSNKVFEFVKGIGRGIKGFATSKAGKTAGIISVVLVATTAVGVGIYKIFFEDGSETLVEGDEFEELTDGGEAKVDTTAEEASEEVTSEE